MARSLFAAPGLVLYGIISRTENIPTALNAAAAAAAAATSSFFENILTALSALPAAATTLNLSNPDYC